MSLFFRFVVGLLSITLLACAPQKTEKPADTAPSPASESRVPSEPVDSPKKVADRVKSASDAVPDWRARHEELKAEFAEQFQAPVVGETLSVTPNGGRAKEGRLRTLGDTFIVLEVEGGAVTFSQAALSPKSRLRLFEQDFAVYHANQALNEERQAYEEKVRKREAKKKVASSTARSKASVPKNDPSDGSVKEVLDYLAKELKNPEKLQVLKWGKVEPYGDGYKVYCQYSAGGSSLGDSTYSMLFLMKANGKVFRQVHVRE